MSKTMTKYQLEHFKDKVNRQFEPLINDQELLVKQFKTEATDKAVDKLSKKIGADKIIAKFRQAEKMLDDKVRLVKLIWGTRRGVRIRSVKKNYSIRENLCEYLHHVSRSASCSSSH